MTNQFGADQGVRWVPVKNDSGEVIPACALMMVTGIDTDNGWFTVDRPDTDGMPGLLVNSRQVIEIDAVGQGCRADPFQIAFDPADGTPANAEKWGAQASKWYAGKDFDGFLVYGDGLDGLANAARVEGAGASSDSECEYVVAISLTPAGGSGVPAECYAAVAKTCDATVALASLASGEEVWLTVSDAGAASPPVGGQHYVCRMSTNTLTISGDTRRRAFGQQVGITLADTTCVVVADPCSPGTGTIDCTDPDNPTVTVTLATKTIRVVSDACDPVPC